jgi:hypothetical protein
MSRILLCQYSELILIASAEGALSKPGPVIDCEVDPKIRRVSLKHCSQSLTLQMAIIDGGNIDMRTILKVCSSALLLSEV